MTLTTTHYSTKVYYNGLNCILEAIRETDENKNEISVSEASINGLLPSMKSLEQQNLSKTLIKELYILIHVSFDDLVTMYHTENYEIDQPGRLSWWHY